MGFFTALMLFLCPVGGLCCHTMRERRTLQDITAIGGEDTDACVVGFFFWPCALVQHNNLLWEHYKQTEWQRRSLWHPITDSCLKAPSAPPHARMQ